MLAQNFWTIYPFTSDHWTLVRHTKNKTLKLTCFRLAFKNVSVFHCLLLLSAMIWNDTIEIREYCWPINCVNFLWSCILLLFLFYFNGSWSFSPRVLRGSKQRPAGRLMGRLRGRNGVYLRHGDAVLRHGGQKIFAAIPIRSTSWYACGDLQAVEFCLPGP